MPMTRWDRKAELARRGVRQSDIARALDVSDTAVSDVVIGRSRSARIEQAIAAALGRAVEEVFPPRGAASSAVAAAPAA